ncbi:MAG: TIGR04255 family protein [Candidatus Obscuribacterales bacterium]|jgi:uncharacterized protein (TIGR04255 family)|nr:TIGR04255 family protein [Candidatus Obscuribacterales bacterium]
MTLTTDSPSDFEDPPLVEVACSVQFDKLFGLRSFQMMKFGEKFEKQFPRVEEKPILIPNYETFGSGMENPRVEVTYTDIPDPPRYWFVSKSGTEMIQIQQDRFIHNWRKVKGNEDYPRYESVKAQFEDNLSSFCQYLDQQAVGAFEPNLVELTYVNAIPKGKPWGALNDIGKMFMLSRESHEERMDTEPESINYSEQHVIEDAGQQIGRIYINLINGKRADKSEVLRLTLTARGIPLGGRNLEGVLRFLDLGNVILGRAFVAFTNPEMHKMWKRVKQA